MRATSIRMRPRSRSRRRSGVPRRLPRPLYNGIEGKRNQVLALKKIEQYLGTGRRKRGVARVFLRPGSGKITINGRELDNYFPTEAARVPVRLPLQTVEVTERVDLLILANGGGFAGQAGAIKLGIARALVAFNPEFRTPLKK